MTETVDGFGGHPDLNGYGVTLRLQHNYSVAIRFNERGAPTFTWVPRYPTFDKAKESRRFWRAYYGARFRAWQDIANSTGFVMLLAGTDGTHIFEPNPEGAQQ
jgi:hypothetical protein